jgi:mannitol-1-phosphate 5-dehydrogenase
VVGTAVGVANLDSVAALISSGVHLRQLRGRPPVDIYLCENSPTAYESLRDAVFARLDDKGQDWARSHLGCVGMVVARMVPPATADAHSGDPLLVTADSYRRLPYDRLASRAPPPPIEGMVAVDDFAAEVQWKLYTYNLVHAALGYLGHLKQYRYIHESFDDPVIGLLVDRALDEVDAALIRRYPGPVTRGGQRRVRDDIRLRFSNPMLMDTVQRVARDPVRKLGPEDRLIGAARLCVANGVFPRSIARIAGAALCYDDPADPVAVKLQDMLRTEGPEAVLGSITGVQSAASDTGGDLGRCIIRAYHEFRRSHPQATTSIQG